MDGQEKGSKGPQTQSTQRNQKLELRAVSSRSERLSDPENAEPAVSNSGKGSSEIHLHNSPKSSPSESSQVGGNGSTNKTGGRKGLVPRLWKNTGIPSSLLQPIRRELAELKPQARSVLAHVLHRSGAQQGISMFRRHQAGGRRVLVVGYHRVCSDFESASQHSIASCLISKDTFRQHVEFLQERFELVNMSQALDVLMGRDRNPQGRDVAAITFDDGYRELVDNALPVLSQLGAVATVYVSSGVVEEGGWFPHDRLYSLLCDWQSSAKTRSRSSSWANRLIEEAREKTGAETRFWLGHLIRHQTPQSLEDLCADLASATAALPLPPPEARALDSEGLLMLKEGGFEIGAHTVGHWVLPHLSEDEILQDLVESKASLENLIGEPVRHFAYCNGYYDSRVIRALKRSGYLSAVTTEDRINRRGQDPYRIARRVLWEGSARGAGNRQSAALLACQLEGTWASLGLSRPEPGELRVPQSTAATSGGRMRTTA